MLLKVTKTYLLTAAGKDEPKANPDFCLCPGDV